ncbi:tRNA (adenosine(37)-N6)-dimethylallyltransferase MiaA, partial [Bacteroidales bacterium OttesenSCG-928-C19]|nr:tRNA (adenosine(37)-N6)-dimethylallyltransferase MiaA [Bacteroidales bacterium OttesenSCG-928-C19]
MITILGPTACGKTNLAVYVANMLDGEIISADSRQVYRGMDIGTGKDLDEYTLNGKQIPYHLIDICEPGEEYNVFRFQKDFLTSYSRITEKGKMPILCGGTGFYIESVLKGYHLHEVPENQELRNELNEKTVEELIETLSSLRKLHNTTDIIDRQRLIRAIEIESFKKDIQTDDFPKIDSVIFGINYDREKVRQRITERLRTRLQTGMIEEVEGLINSSVSPEKLLFYGLEYKYVTLYLQNQLSYDEMFRLLNIAIHQFAKRQMTWFRKMERSGINIHWIDGELSIERKLEEIE